MRLKGLVWFFTIALILISIWELSYTWVVRNYEGDVKAQATRLVAKQAKGLPPEDKDALIQARTQRILDSTKEKEIYPLLGTSYQKAKEAELNLGLDLQGGISVTMDVALDGLIKSLSNNSKDPQLLKALQVAKTQTANSDENLITLFTREYAKQNGPNRLKDIFAGAGKEVKISDNDNAVTTKLQTIAKGAINQTYKILVKRIDKFGVAQPNINLDENKGIINVELAGIKDPERITKFLQSSANLQFWEVYNISELGQALTVADKNLQGYLNGITAGDTSKLNDTTLNKQNQAPFFRVINPIDVQKDANGKQYFVPSIGSVALQDTATFYSYINNDVVKSALPGDVKFLFGIEEKAAKGGQRFFPLYAIKTLPGSEKAPIEGDAVANAIQQFDQVGKPSISMQMNPTGTKQWARLTTKNVGRPIAITLDDIVYSAPNVNGAIEGGNSEISGSFTVEQAKDLSQILTSGKLDAPAKIVAMQVVGPTLGAEAVRGGAMAFGIAFLVIFILMLVYYNTGGWVANIALILNLLFTVGVLAALGFTLTAAGIAGLVLTIGMAVDTNVVIFERIKDELNKGKSYQQAINDGYARSLAPVLDAHVTSLLTAIILLYFGLGPVLGFATTQIIGILLSLFCGILVSRLITDFWTNKNRHLKYFTSVSRNIFKNANYDFVKFRKYAYIISAVVLVLGIASFFNGFDEGVEFKGGRSYTVQFDNPVKNDEVRDELKNVFGDNPTIKTVGDNRHLNITTSYRINEANVEEDVKMKLFTGLKKVLPANATYESFSKNNIQAFQTILPSISDDLKRGAVKATIFALFAIFMYIFIRFKDWRYSVGTIFTLLHDVLVTLIVFSFFKNIVPFPLEIDQHFIAAILTVIGFSMNDTVIVFDRVREYSRDMKNAPKSEIINKAVNHTLSRTIMTSLTVFLTLLILFIFGGEVTRGFAFAMLIGVITGSYSSIFVGAPVLLEFAKDKPLGAAAEVVVKKKEKAPEL
ncbi:MAG: protein translocase subunit SecDF [Gloeobacteraceae cyanobacterium ES-bin-316]|nr:protein translocase subunit SecDF [Ferruginibacter sp.]